MGDIRHGDYSLLAAMLILISLIVVQWNSFDTFKRCYHKRMDGKLSAHIFGINKNPQYREGQIKAHSGKNSIGAPKTKFGQDVANANDNDKIGNDKCNHFAVYFFIAMSVLELIAVTAILATCLFICCNLSNATATICKTVRKPEKKTQYRKISVISSATVENLSKRAKKKQFHIVNDHLVEINEKSDPSLYRFIESLFHTTWKDTATSAGLDATGLSHGGLKIQRVFVLKNSDLFRLYDAAYKATEARFDLPNELKLRPILTNQSPDVHIKIEPDIVTQQPENEQLLQNTHVTGEMRPGEVLLYHGTKMHNVENILKHGFDLDKSKRGLYGTGIYLAESSQKSDQYTDEPNNRRKTNLAMFLVRTALGKVEMFQRDEDTESWDTQVAGCEKRFREFLKRDTKQLYPEFLVIYDRGS